MYITDLHHDLEQDNSLLVKLSYQLVCSLDPPLLCFNVGASDVVSPFLQFPCESNMCQENAIKSDTYFVFIRMYANLR